MVHPIYGDEVVSTGCRASEAEILASCRDFHVVKVFVESAIRADVRKQNHEWSRPRQFYVDTLRRCYKCRRRFIFFAREQQYWYEELKINVGTTAKFCCECAADNREIKAAMERYEASVGREDMDEESLLQSAADLVLLSEAEILKGDERLRRMKNTLLRRKIPAEKWAFLAAALK